MKDNIYYNQTKLLLRVLPLIFKQKDFALKGGTAINFFYRNMPRLSVDIDLVYLPIKNWNETLTDINELLSSLKSKIEQRIPGSSVVASTKDSNIRKLIVKYDTATVKIEPNIIIRGGLFSPEVKSITSQTKKHFEISVKSKLLSFADLYGGKICAALDRQHPRDLFDVKLLMENESITDNIKYGFIFYLISHNRPMIEILNPNYNPIKKSFDKEFQGMTFKKVCHDELLKVRDKLVKDINQILSTKDKKFLISINTGKPNWNLFPYPKIRKYPSVKWKLMNIRKMNSKKHEKVYQKLSEYFNK